MSSIGSICHHICCKVCCIMYSHHIEVIKGHLCKSISNVKTFSSWSNCICSFWWLSVIGFGDGIGSSNFVILHKHRLLFIQHLCSTCVQLLPRVVSKQLNVVSVTICRMTCRCWQRVSWHATLQVSQCNNLCLWRSLCLAEADLRMKVPLHLPVHLRFLSAVIFRQPFNTFVNC